MMIAVPYYDYTSASHWLALGVGVGLWNRGGEMNPIDSLLHEICHFDCELGVFQVAVYASGHRNGITASATMRTDSQGQSVTLESHAETASAALQGLLEILRASYGKCPHCGGYKHPQEAR